MFDRATVLMTLLSPGQAACDRRELGIRAAKRSCGQALLGFEVRPGTFVPGAPHTREALPVQQLYKCVARTCRGTGA